jgi:CRP-like cAMP-binding protein
MTFKIESVFSKSKAIAILKRLSLFNGLTGDELEYLIEYCGIEKFNNDTAIFRQGDYAKSLCVILSGSVEISVDRVGTVNSMEAGEILGELGVVTSLSRSATATATEDETFLLTIDKNDLNFMLGKQPRISYILMKNIASELAEKYLALTLDSNHELYKSNNTSQTRP